jgi:hypothetical protein
MVAINWTSIPAPRLILEDGSILLITGTGEPNAIPVALLLEPFLNSISPLRICDPFEECCHDR